MENKTKFCKKCKEEKSTLEFHRHKGRSDGLNSICKFCKKEEARLYLLNNKEKEKLRKQKWNMANSERIKEYKAYKRTPDLDNKRRAEHKKKFPELANASRAKRRAAKLRATPRYADESAIRRIYKLAIELSRSTGVEHHVDHIVPLINPLVCGLHWEGNLRVITAKDNISKGNRLWPDMP